MTTTTEVIQSLTGWDEIAIEQACGKPIEHIAEQGRDILLTRVLGAVLISRETGGDYKAVYRDVMGKPLSELEALFEDEPDDLLPEEPDSDAGKDSSLPEETPAT